MQSLTRPPYSAAEVQAELERSGRTLRFAYELLDKDYKSLGWLDYVHEGRVENNTFAQVKRTGQFKLQDTSEINFLTDLMKPWVQLLMPDGSWAAWPQGVFMMEATTRDITTSTYRRTVKGYDRLLILKEDAFSNRHSIPAGASYRTHIIDLLESAGILNHSISDTDKLLPAAIEWPIGTPKLKAINDLLKAINFNSLYFSASGVAIGQPYQSPSDKGAQYTYDSKNIGTSLQVKLDAPHVPNQWVAYTSTSEGAGLRAVYTNDNPASETSTVSRGRIVSAPPIRVDAPDLATLQDIVKRTAEAESQIYQETKFQSIKMPHHGDADVLRLTAAYANYNYLAVEKSWRLELSTEGHMEHVIQRLVSV